MFESLYNFCEKLSSTADEIDAIRLPALTTLADYLTEIYTKEDVSAVVFVCTHNSRRSLIGELMLALCAEYYSLPPLHTYSAGTEATRLSTQACEALTDIGYEIKIDESTDTSNPIHHFRWSDTMSPHLSFSKKYTHSHLPTSDYCGVMVCNEADAGCPVIQGMAARVSLPYLDPKRMDGTLEQHSAYMRCIREIGREMMWVAHSVKDRLV